ncbi:hypothetical protein ACFV2L_35555 [Streptomyces sp. NPDC059687]|uniref:hypothetical protein n=1 Tax=unclassified Streptomyces TaxID=2593676 RepID=UPI00343CDC69
MADDGLVWDDISWWALWSLVKGDIGNLAPAELGQVTRAVKRKLKMLQYRPDVIDGCLTLPA